MEKRNVVMGAMYLHEMKEGSSGYTSLGDFARKNNTLYYRKRGVVLPVPAQGYTINVAKENNIIEIKTASVIMPMDDTNILNRLKFMLGWKKMVSPIKLYGENDYFEKGNLYFMAESLQTPESLSYEKLHTIKSTLTKRASEFDELPLAQVVAIYMNTENINRGEVLKEALEETIKKTYPKYFNILSPSVSDEIISVVEEAQDKRLGQVMRKSFKQAYPKFERREKIGFAQ